MSQFQPASSGPPSAPAGNGLVITGLVFALLGFIIPLCGIVAIILAIVALVKPAAPGKGKGFAAAVLIIAIVGTMFNCMAVTAGVLLPALGKARQVARQAVSQSQLRQVGIAMSMYADQNEQWFPESADGLDRLVSAGLLAPDELISPHANRQVGVSYIYVPADKPTSDYADPSRIVVAYQNPAIVRGDLIALFMDGHIEELSRQELNQRLSAQGAAPAPQTQNP